MYTFRLAPLRARLPECGANAGIADGQRGDLSRRILRSDQCLAAFFHDFHGYGAGVLKHDSITLAFSAFSCLRLSGHSVAFARGSNTSASLSIRARSSDCRIPPWTSAPTFLFYIRVFFLCATVRRTDHVSKSRSHSAYRALAPPPARHRCFGSKYFHKFIALYS